MSHFDTFWSRYPKKVNKVGCAKKWKAKKLDEQWESISKFLDWAPVHDSKWKGGFIPNPETFINQERWNDHDYHLKPPKMYSPSRGAQPKQDEGPQMSRWARAANQMLMRLAYQDSRRGFFPIGDGLPDVLAVKNELVRDAEKAERDGDKWDDDEFIAVMRKALETALKGASNAQRNAA